MFAIPPVQPLDLSDTETAFAIEDNRIGVWPLFRVGQTGGVCGILGDSVLRFLGGNRLVFGHLDNF